MTWTSWSKSLIFSWINSVFELAWIISNFQSLNSWHQKTWKRAKNFYLITCKEKLESLAEQFTLWTNLKFFKKFLLCSETSLWNTLLFCQLVCSMKEIWNTSNFHYLNGFVEKKIHFLPSNSLPLKNFLVWIPCLAKFEFLTNQLGS